MHAHNPCDTLNNCPGHLGIRKYCACRAMLPNFAGVAQLVEHLICNQRVGGSNPFASSRKTVFRKQRLARMYTRVAHVLTHSIRHFSGVAGVEHVSNRARIPAFRFPNQAVMRDEGVFAVDAGGFQFFAQVGEWLKPTDCKSVPPSEVRRFESFPVHQFEAYGTCA